MTAYLVWALAVSRPFPRPQIRPRAGLAYLLSVLAMLVTINGGGRILVALDREPLAIAVSVVAVGAHFPPFARAFHTPMFAVLGWVMVPLGLVGLVVGWTVDPRAAAIAAVLAGLAMLVIIVVDARRPIGSIRGFTQGLRAAGD